MTNIFSRTVNLQIVIVSDIEKYRLHITLVCSERVFIRGLDTRVDITIVCDVRNYTYQFMVIQQFFYYINYGILLFGRDYVKRNDVN